MLSIISERGRNLVPWLGHGNSGVGVVELSRALLSEKGEASGIAIAIELLQTYSNLSAEARFDYFLILANEFCADIDLVEETARAFLQSPSGKASALLHTVSESQRQELFRRLNHAPGGTKRLVAMRQDLLNCIAENSESKSDLLNVDADFVHLFSSWFNRGFLVLERITWATPAIILEKIIEYEAVHEIDSWDELRRRIQPPDRRCYAFFHPALTDDPLIFVEVALTREISHSVGEVLAEERDPVKHSKINTAVFYSISNCQKGLKKVSFGNFLIKQVVEELARELPQIKTFVTLSPIPGFLGWMKSHLKKTDDDGLGLSPEGKDILTAIESGEWPVSDKLQERMKNVLMPLAAAYLTRPKSQDNRSLDPVAQFHLGNGARLERLNWAADNSSKGLAQSAGMMVNYLYERDEIEKNHQSFENGKVIASSSITKLSKSASFPSGAS